MRPSPPFTAAALFSIWFLLSPRALSPQDFSSIGGDLSALENLIQDTLANSEAQRKQLEDLRRSLTGSCFKTEVLKQQP
jgi:hypothetical protein